MLEATIWSTDGIDIANDTATIISSSYIGNWFFFAVTVNSGSKLLTLYSQNGANPPSTSDPLISSSITYTYVAKAYSYEKSTLIGGKGIEIYKGNYADFRIYPGSSIDTILTQYNCNLYSAATYLDPHCTSWSSIWYCSTCETGYFIKNGLCQSNL
ncbi:unnamed protein product [Blepharisma stoltei]|uniref:Uncharacterized protein n=1 Tax=Blepharisma stoltei TaxID=1481888 RepID=A0AAU9K2M0_9CILI|nr:unnamed protein product [Blepharisma stoltei]